MMQGQERSDSWHRLSPAPTHAQQRLELLSQLEGVAVGVLPHGGLQQRQQPLLQHVPRQRHCSKVGGGAAAPRVFVPCCVPLLAVHACV